MTFPNVLGVQETVVAAMQTSHNIGMGATWNAGDLAVMIVVGSTEAGHTTYTITTPSGFTAEGASQFNEGVGDDRMHTAVFWKVADGTEDGTTVDVVTADAVSMAAQVYRYEVGTHGSDVEVSSFPEGEAANPDPPSLTPSWGAGDTGWIAGCTHEDSDFEATGAPANYTNLTTTVADSTEDACLSTARRSNNTATEDPGAFAALSEKFQAFLIAVKPGTTILYPTGLVSAGGWTDEAGGTTDLHLVVDDTSAGDSDYIRTPVDTATDITFDITNMPSDFVAMSDLDVEIRHSRGGVEGGDAGGGNDTYELYAYITDSSGAVALAGANSTPANGQLLNTSTAGYVTETDTVSFSYVNTTATKTQWDGARLTIEAVYAATGGGDADRLWVDFIRLINVTYSATPPERTIYQRQGRPIWVILNR